MEKVMSDVYVYRFIAPNGPDGGPTLSTRAATLDAIKGLGTPVMESQIVVDHSEVDAAGFLIGTATNDSPAMNNLAAQISSLEVRAVSRDSAASASADGIEQYMLGLESRELRKQAKILKNPPTELVPHKASERPASNDLQHCENLLTQ
jgi:hypothetical protein